MKLLPDLDVLLTEHTLSESSGTYSVALFVSPSQGFSTP
jgi:hypothetical protein